MKAKFKDSKAMSLMLTAIVVSVLATVIRILGVGTTYSALRVGYMGEGDRSSWSAKYITLDGSMKHTLYPDESRNTLHMEVETEKGEISIQIKDAKGNVVFSETNIGNDIFDVKMAGKVVVRVEGDHHKGGFEMRVQEAVEEESIPSEIGSSNGEVLRMDKMQVDGKEYEVSYLGKLDISDSLPMFQYVEFWRLENAYDDFKDYALNENSASCEKFPVTVENGQVFLIEYVEWDDFVIRKFYRSDGEKRDGKPIVQGFSLKEEEHIQWSYQTPVEKQSGQIMLYGEAHGVKRIMDEELRLWEKYYEEGMRDLFVELPYYDAEFLNEWMKAENNDILNDLFEDSKGTAIYSEDVKNFYKSIKANCPETVFHGTDVGHTYWSTGKRYLECLRANGQEKSEKYTLAKEAIKQGQYFYSHDSDAVYREIMMVENFLREYDKVNCADIMGIYGGGIRILRR